MKAVTLKYTVQTVNEWRAGYSESCKSGSGASVRKPTAAMRQGAGYLAYGTPPRSARPENSETFGAAAAPCGGSTIPSASRTAAPSWRIQSATARATTSGWATKRSPPTGSESAQPLTVRWRKSPTALKRCWNCCGRPGMRSRAKKSHPC